MGGIGDFLGGIGKLLGKGSTYLQGRVEKLKNEKTALMEEKQALLAGGCDDKKSARVLWIDNRLNVINGLLGNKAQDD